MINHGLNNHQLKIISEILAPYADNIERVAIFGSRAMENYRANSDIDLVIYGKLDEGAQDRIYSLFKDSALSIAVDVNVYDLVKYLPLKKHIDEESKTLFAKGELHEALKILGARH